MESQRPRQPGPPHHAVAGPAIAERLWALVRTVLFFLIVPGGVTALVPWLLVRDRATSGQPPLGAPLIVAGAALLLWSGFGFSFVGRGTPAPWDAPRELVVWGPYRAVRNPMYVGVLLVLGGEAIAFDPALLAYAALVWATFHAFVVAYEEPTLAASFGASYGDYRRRVAALDPAPRCASALASARGGAVALRTRAGPPW